MAIVLDPNKLKKDQQTDPTQPSTIGAGQTFGPAANAPTAGAKTTSSGFTGLQKYLQANKPEQTAAKVGGKIQEQGQRVTGAIGQAKDTFQQQAKAGRLASEANVGVAGQAQKDVVGFANDAENIGKFRNILTGAYQGPQGIQNQAALAEQARGAAQMGQGTRTDTGRQAALQQFFGRPTYSKGQSRFDSLLLGQDKSGALQQARVKTAGLEQLAGKEAQIAQQQAKGFGAEDESFKQATRGQTAQMGQTLESDLVANQRSARDNAEWERKQLVSGLNRGVISKSLADKYGFSSGQIIGDDMDLSQFRVREPTTFAEVADQRQQATAAALAKLGGGIQGFEKLEDLGKQLSGPIGGYKGVDVSKFGDMQRAAQARQEAEFNKNPALRNMQHAADSVGKQQEELAGVEKQLQDLVKGGQKQDANTVGRLKAQRDNLKSGIAQNQATVSQNQSAWDRYQNMTSRLRIE